MTCLYVVMTVVLLMASFEVGLSSNVRYNVEEEADWQEATATWYGSPNGDRSEGIHTNNHHTIYSLYTFFLPTFIFCTWPFCR
ncbi:hypothetical protein SUGI_0111480 [Cryptomeria japonica]|nr:hypothetical protein SUGI_0111480 [Cryptomeria japonica]